VGKLIVMSEKDYSEWLERGGNRFEQVESMEEVGRSLFDKKGCGNCHTSGDTERAPALVGLIGQQRRFTSGAARTADDAYLRESILQPYDHITQGYTNTMPAYKGQLSEEQVLAIITYLKSLGTAPGSGLGQHEQQVREPADRRGAPQNATDIANERKSAPATQFQQRGATN
jgi:cytochrome c oxidase subunit 2